MVDLSAHFFSKKWDSFKPPLQHAAEIVLLQRNLDFTPLQIFITVFWMEIRVCSSQAFNLLTSGKVDAGTCALKIGWRALGKTRSKTEMWVDAAHNTVELTGLSISISSISIFICIIYLIYIYIYLYIYVPMSVFIMIRGDSEAHTCEGILGNKEAHLLNQIPLCASRSSLPQTPPAFLSLTYQETQVINKFSCYGSCFLLPLEWSMLFDMVPIAFLPPATLSLGAVCQGHLPSAGPDSVSACSRPLILCMLTVPWRVRHPPAQEDLSSTEPASPCLDSSCISRFWSPSSSLPPAEMPPSLPRNSRRWHRCWSNINPELLPGGTLHCMLLEAALYSVLPCTGSSRAEEKTSARAVLAVPVIDTIRCSLLCHILLPKVDFSCGQHVSVYPAWLKNWAKRTLSPITDNYTLLLQFGFSNCLSAPTASFAGASTSFHWTYRYGQKKQGSIRAPLRRTYMDKSSFVFLHP